jgi:L-iditol 2-dehydrogenase
VKALVYKGPGIVELEDVPEPVRKEDEVLIKIRAVGICGSDVEGYLGKSGRRIPPMIMGHEFAGEVIECNEDSKLNQGDKVTAYPKFYCGKCDYCKVGLTNICPYAEFLGVLDKDGAMQEYISVPEKYVYKADKETDYINISMVEPLAVAYRSVLKINIEELRDANYVLLVGAGTIGLLILQVLRLKGIENIIVSDLSDYRLKIARKLGAKYVINPGNTDHHSKIVNITDGSMVDYSFEAVGFSKTAAQSLNELKIGGTAVWIGNAQKMIEVNMQEIVTKELIIKGNYIYTVDDFVDSLRLIEQDKIDCDSIITLIESLENGGEMFKKLTQNTDSSMIKIILTK